MPSACLLFNPKAGRFSAENVARSVSANLKDRGWDVEVLATRSGEHVTVLAKDAANAGVDVVAIAGGDGSIGRAAAGLAATRTALAVIPTGTANVLARELEIPIANPKNLAYAGRISDMIVTWLPTPVDIGICNGTPFLLWAGIGLDAQVVHQSESNRSRLRKLLAYPEYGLRAFRNAASWPGIDVALDARSGPDKEPVTIEDRFQLAIISNIRLYAGGLVTLSPAAILNDGRMDLWLFKGRGILDAWRNAMDLLRGRHPESEKSCRVPFSELTLHLDRPTFLHTDGDPQKESDVIQVRVEQRCLNVLMPAAARTNLTN